MAITVPTNEPLDLLSQIKTDISEQRLQEWELDSDGDMTLSNAEYRAKAWFRPYVKDGKLVFGIIPANEPKMTQSLFAHYHGRLLGTLLEHYPLLASETMTSSIVNKFYDL
jgi:hypothetical protein